MTKTQTAPSLREKYTSLGIQWESNDEYTPDGTGFQLVEGMFGVRPVYEGVLVGCSTFCLYWCEVVKRHKLTDQAFSRFPGSELWVFKIPDPMFDAIKPHLPRMTQYLCLPVNTADAFVSWNWNPVVIRTPEEAKRYLTGWRE